MKADRTELHDLSARHPEKVKEMEKLYVAWAARANVVPFAQLVEYDRQRKRK